MTSLFGYLGHRYTRNPHKQATFLGLDGSGLGRWSIMGTVYTGTVTTVGGGSPTVGRTYPGFCQDPDSWRGWAVLVEPEHRIKPYKATFEDEYTEWMRFGISKADERFSLTGLTLGLYLGGTPTPLQERPISVSVRSMGAVLVYGSGQNLVERDDQSDTTVQTDLGGEVLDVHGEDSGRIYSLVVGSPSGGDPTYGDAYDAGFEEAANDSSSYYAGYDAFDGGYEYDPQGDYGDNSYPDFHPAPAPYNDGGTLEQGWLDGLYAGWLDAYNAGWTDAGGTVP